MVRATPCQPKTRTVASLQGTQQLDVCILVSYCYSPAHRGTVQPWNKAISKYSVGFLAILQPAYLAVGQLSRTPIQSVHSSYTSPYADSSGATLLDSVGIGKVQSAYISSQLKVIPLFRYSGTSLNGHSL